MDETSDFRDANSVYIDNPLCLREWWIRFPAYILPERTVGSRHRHGRKPTVDARHSVSLIALINKGQSGGGQGAGERARERMSGEKGRSGGWRKDEGRGGTKDRWGPVSFPLSRISPISKLQYLTR